MSFRVGQSVACLNLKYKDGTRLRGDPVDDRNFNGVWAANDVVVAIVAIQGAMAQVRKADGDKGWIKMKNITETARVAGVCKGIVTNEVVTPDPEYVKGMRIYGVGIREDPIPGQKFGKGLQHLTSTYWLMDMAVFIATHIKQLQAILQFAQDGSAKHKGFDYRYLLNLANHLFLKAEVCGLKTQESLEFFLMATWLVMAAAEVDEFPFRKYTLEERRAQRLVFYKTYLEPTAGPATCSDVGHDDAGVIGKFASPDSRADMLPAIALERLGVNNELSGLKYPDPEQPMREGFMLSKRIDSLKRHFASTHTGDESEDHIIHLLWNFMALYHVNRVFPKKNDLVNYATLDAERGGSDPALMVKAYIPTTSLEKIGDRMLESSGEQLGAGAIPSDVLKLDWNEGVISPPKSVSDAMMQFILAANGNYLKWYPQLGGGSRLRAKLAEYSGCIPENILVTNGSDDALILICRTFLGPQTRSCFVPVPTYEHFVTNAGGTGCNMVRFEPKNMMDNSVDEMTAEIAREAPAVVYFVSPNNPLGTEWTSKQVSQLAGRFPKTVFVLDEAYHEFATIDTSTGKPRSCAKLVEDYQNVVVTRTFSKAFCLASVRCGYILAHPTTVEQLRILYNPKSVNAMAEVGCVAALDELNTYYLPYIEATNKGRERFLEELRSIGVECLSGGAGNFACIIMPTEEDVKKAVKALEDRNIYVRNITSRVPRCFRVSIGLNMSRVITVMRELKNAGSFLPSRTLEVNRLNEEASSQLM